MNIENTQLTEAEMMRAWKQRSREYDGLFVLGVKTTGIFCKPSCPSRPQPQHLEFFPNSAEARNAGYRPCKRCEPEIAAGTLPKWAADLMQRAESSNQRISSRDLQDLGIEPARARRWFSKNLGTTFAAWCRHRRLARAFEQIGSGTPIDHAVLENGYESHSGFRAAFAKVFEKSPGRDRTGNCVRVALFDSPLGTILAAADNQAILELEFADVRLLQKTYETIRTRHGFPVVPGHSPQLNDLERELKEYFAGDRREFTLSLAPKGTPFQQTVWAALQQIPYGQTASYEDIATRIGSPTAVRAVARANATNRLCILIPCHRVIAKSGALSGYGAGVWRKRLLLKLENG